MDPVELRNRFTYHKPTGNKTAQHELIRSRCGELAEYINAELPESREKSLAVTHLEEVTMWANAAIARN